MAERKLKALDAARKAREQLTEMTGREPESVLAVERDEDDGWRVTVEVLEMQRVPNSMDLLGCYAIRLDKSGDMLEYGRLRRYARGSSDEDS